MSRTGFNFIQKQRSLLLPVFAITRKLHTMHDDLCMCLNAFSIPFTSPPPQKKTRMAYNQLAWQASDGEGKGKDKRMKSDKIGRGRIAVARLTSPAKTFICLDLHTYI